MTTLVVNKSGKDLVIIVCSLGCAVGCRHADVWIVEGYEPSARADLWVKRLETLHGPASGKAKIVLIEEDNRAKSN
jgi:hypothetical protein